MANCRLFHQTSTLDFTGGCTYATRQVSVMPDWDPQPIRLSDLNSVWLLVVAAVVAAMVVGLLVRDYYVTQRRVRRFFQKRKPSGPVAPSDGAPRGPAS
jgi:hypothetical protein